MYSGSYGRRNVVQRMKPFLRLFKLCGMFTNEITEGRLKRCSWPFFCAFWIGVYAAYACFLLYYSTGVRLFNTRVFTDVMKHMSAYINLSLNAVIAYTEQRRFAKFFDRLESYDDEVARMKNARRDNLWIAWIAMFSMTAINLSLASVMTVETSTGFLYFVTLSDICMTIMHICGTVWKFLMLRLLLARFKHLNERIVPRASWDEKRPGTIKILDVRTLHSMLYDAHVAFNDIYRNPLLIWFGSLMLHVIANIRIFRERRLLIASAFVVPQILQVLTLCAICHYTAEEANKIASVLSENMCSLATAEQTMAKISVLTYFLHYHVSFDAAGFFTIDLPLLESVIAAITTYFIILI